MIFVLGGNGTHAGANAKYMRNGASTEPKLILFYSNCFFTMPERNN